MIIPDQGPGTGMMGSYKIKDEGLNGEKSVYSERMSWEFLSL